MINALGQNWQYDIILGKPGRRDGYHGLLTRTSVFYSHTLSPAINGIWGSESI